MKQVLVHNSELTAEHTAHVDVGGVWLKALVVAKNLRSRCSGHWGHQQRVADLQHDVSLRLQDLTQ